MPELDDNLIQRIPRPGDKWRGLDNDELMLLFGALSTREGVVRGREDGEHLRVLTLMRDAAVETERRGIDLDGWAAEQRERSTLQVLPIPRQSP